MFLRVSCRFFLLFGYPLSFRLSRRFIFLWSQAPWFSTPTSLARRRQLGTLKRRSCGVVGLQFMSAGLLGSGVHGYRDGQEPVDGAFLFFFSVLFLRRVPPVLLGQVQEALLARGPSLFPLHVLLFFFFFSANKKTHHYRVHQSLAATIRWNH